jgi:hypothetical protein
MLNNPPFLYLPGLAGLGCFIKVLAVSPKTIKATVITPPKRDVFFELICGAVIIEWYVIPTG